jgi:hypothetical protein
MGTTPLIRLKRVALKAESTPGVDSIAGSPVAADYVTSMATFRMIQDSTPNPVENGGLDDAAPIPGGMRAEIVLTIPLAGSGAPGTAPEWGKLLKACRMEEVITAAAVGLPTAATAGTANTVTGTAAFNTTAQLYRGMPLLLTGNPAAGAQDVVLDYTSGRVMTLARTYSPVLSTSTLIQVPINVLYRPTSDDTVGNAFTCYADLPTAIGATGLRHRILGCRGSWSIGLVASRPASIVIRLTGIVDGYNEAATIPAGYVPTKRQAPRWESGLSQVNRALMQCESMSWDMGVRTFYPENPEAPEGFNPPIITGAAPRITANPFSNTTNTPTRTGAFRAGTPVPVAAMWGSVAGNRFALSCPSAQIVDLQSAERGELGVDALLMQPDTVDATMFLACW